MTQSVTLETLFVAIAAITDSVCGRGGHAKTRDRACPARDVPSEGTAAQLR